ncbi:MAG: FecR domain-containing protein, partial [bacterium]|nr:FecR domain-containing protein [bacterium]
INGKLYRMVYVGYEQCEVQDLTPIQNCPNGCVTDDPYAGCAPAPTDHCSDFYSRFSVESCYGSTHYYDCYCNPQNGEPICELEECLYGCDSAGVSCAAGGTPSTPISTADCAQPGAVSTGSGCKSSLRCSTECAPTQSQLMYPACTCFDANFPDPDGAMVVGAGVTLKKEDGQSSQSSKTFISLGDTITTSSNPAMIVFPDGTYLKLEANSEVEMDVEGFFLKEGGCWVKVEKDRHRVYIKTETLTTGARGTAFEVWDTGSEEGVRVIEGTVFVDIQDPATEEWYTADFAAGSVVTYDKSTGELTYVEGNGQTLTSEFNSFTSDASNLVSTYSGGTSGGYE